MSNPKIPDTIEEVPIPTWPALVILIASANEPASGFVSNIILPPLSSPALVSDVTVFTRIAPMTLPSAS